MPPSSPLVDTQTYERLILVEISAEDVIRVDGNVIPVDLFPDALIDAQMKDQKAQLVIRVHNQASAEVLDILMKEVSRQSSSKVTVSTAIDQRSRTAFSFR